MNELLIIILIILFLVLIVSFLLSLIVKRTNNLMKNVFIDKMSEFDFLIGDKEKKVDELNDDIKQKTELKKELEEEIEKYNNVENNNQTSMVMPKFTDFEDGNLFYNYKIIKEKFNYNVKDIIEKFVLKNNKDNNDDYKLYQKIRQYFNFDVIYKLSLYQEKEQYEIVSELLEEEEKNKLGKYFNETNFDIKKIVEFLDEQLIKTSPTIRVIVGNKSEKYDNIDKNVVTLYDENVTEGFKIIYKGIIYDYSI